MNSKESLTTHIEALETQPDALSAIKAAYRAKNQFISDMGHELRTPLTAIMGFSEMLQEEAQENDQHTLVEDLQKIRDSGKFLLETINDMVKISKLENGEFPFHPNVFPVKVLVDQIITQHSRRLEQKQNTLTVEYDGDPGLMCSDQDWVKDILDKLLANAIKFASGDSILLTLSRFVRESQDWIRFDLIGACYNIPIEDLRYLLEGVPSTKQNYNPKYNQAIMELLVSQRMCQALGGTTTLSSGTYDAIHLTIELPART